MTDRKCASCDAPAKDTETICHGCQKRTERRLADFAWFEQQLEIAMAGQAVLTEPNDGGKSAETGLAYGEQAADALHAMRSLLVSWLRLTNEELHLPLPPNRIPVMAAHLADRVRKLKAHEAAGDLVAEVHEVSRQAERAIDIPQFRLVAKVGRCPEQYEEGQCKGHLVATVPNDETSAPLVACDECRKEWPAEQWNRLGHLVKARVA